MGYFSNGEEKSIYETKYCDNCDNNDENEAYCPVWEAHILYNYKDSDKKGILEILIPRDDNGEHKQCRMFRRRNNMGDFSKETSNDILFIVDNDKEVLRICKNGDFLVNGKKVVNDIEVYETFKIWLGKIIQEEK